MTILFDYFRDHFEIVKIGKGYVLKVKQSLIDSLGGATSFTKTFLPSGATTSKDFTLEANYSPANYPDTAHGGTTVSGELGDGSNEPKFWVIGKNLAAANGVTRTTTNRLRVQHSTTTSSTLWPEVADALTLWIPLPHLHDLSVDFTLSSNAPGQGASNPVHCGLAVGSVGSTENQRLATIRWLSSSATAMTEGVTLQTDAYGTAAVDSYISSGVCTKHYRIEVHGPNAAVFGGAVGATVANTLIQGRSNAFYTGRSGLHFYLSVGRSAGTPYAEIGALSVTAKRAVF
jgi:hypothetical protein